MEEAGFSHTGQSSGILDNVCVRACVYLYVSCHNKN